MELIVLRGDEEHRLHVERRQGRFEVRLGGRVFEVDSVATDGSVRSLLIGGRQFEVAVRAAGDNRYLVSTAGGLEELEVLDPLTHLAAKGARERAAHGPQRVAAYMPGKVVTVLVEEGQQVIRGQGLVVLEAMKMENEILAERDGTVRHVFVSPGQAVEGGDPLFELE